MSEDIKQMAAHLEAVIQNEVAVRIGRRCLR